jgi:hypothetical protein
MAEPRTLPRRTEARPAIHLKENWLLLLLAGLALLLFAFSLEDVRSINTPALAHSTLLGALCGLLLAFSRLSGAQAALYSTLLALPACVQLSTSILPSLVVARTLSFGEWLQLVNWRLLVFLSQAPDWIKSIPNQVRPGASKGMEFLLALVAWSLSVWLFWWLLRRQQALAALLPVGIFFGFNVFYQSKHLNLLLTFLLASLLLLAVASFRRQHYIWEQRGLSYPYEQGEWPTSALVIGVLIVLAARLAVQVGTTQGRQDLVELFRRPAPAAGSATETAQAFEALGAARPAIWIGIDNLQNFDTPPAPLDTTVLWARIRPSGRQIAISPAYYLRAEIFTRYTGSGWQSAAVQSFPQGGSAETGATCDGQILEQEIEILAQHGETLFAANAPLRATENAAIVFVLPDNSTLLRGATDTYQVTSCSIQPDAALLRSAAGEFPAAIRETYLQLPATLPGRVRQLGNQIAGQAQTNFDKALSIQTYLRTYYPYTLEVPAPPAGQDAVDYFLFEAPGGYCSYYASAMVVLLRLQGVPARLVSGFVAAQYSQERSAYRVPAAAAHAWVEAYFPVYGWVTFEPTPSQQALAYDTAAHETAETPSSPSSRRGSSFNIARLLKGVLLAATGFFGCALLIGAIRLRRFWKFQEEIDPLYHQMRQALALAGLSASPSVTPHEFLIQVCAPALSEKHPLHLAVRAATRSYILSAFSPHHPERTQILAVQKQWRASFPAWLKLWMQVKSKLWLNWVKHWRLGKRM